MLLDCVGLFDRFSGDLGFTVKPGEPVQGDCPGYTVLDSLTILLFELFN